MSKLFNAYFNRLSNWKIFQILVLIMLAGGAAVGVIFHEKAILFDLPYMVGMLMFPHYVGIILGIFNYPLLTNGTIRNQLSIGHSRGNIYLADWAASCAFSAALFLALSLGIFGAGAIFGDTSEISAKNILSGLVLSVLQVIFFATLTQLLCVIFKGIKSLLAIYFVNQIVMFAGILLMTESDVPKKVFYLFPTVICMQQSSYDIPAANPLAESANGIDISAASAALTFDFLPAAAVMLIEIATVFAIGIAYFRRTDIN